MDQLAIRERRDVLDGVLLGNPEEILCRVTQVRREHHVRQRLEWIVVGQRLAMAKQ